MIDSHVHIDELVLRIPGVSAAFARDLGERVARIIASRLATTTTPVADLSAIDLKLHMAPGTSTELMAEKLATAILARLG
ncbi:MAG TPA: hypothetical protein VFG83_05355 [Kofleriaceae bacterium]|nr:hypothetical protein [Kofleriaceae bacterium]